MGKFKNSLRKQHAQKVLCLILAAALTLGVAAFSLSMKPAEPRNPFTNADRYELPEQVSSMLTASEPEPWDDAVPLSDMAEEIDEPEEPDESEDSSMLNEPDEQALDGTLDDSAENEITTLGKGGEESQGGGDSDGSDLRGDGDGAGPGSGSGDGTGNGSGDLAGNGDEGKEADDRDDKFDYDDGFGSIDESEPLKQDDEKTEIGDIIIHTSIDDYRLRTGKWFTEDDVDDTESVPFTVWITYNGDIISDSEYTLTVRRSNNKGVSGLPITPISGSYNFPLIGGASNRLEIAAEFNDPEALFGEEALAEKPSLSSPRYNDQFEYRIESGDLEIIMVSELQSKDNPIPVFSEYILQFKVLYKGEPISPNFLDVYHEMYDGHDDWGNYFLEAEFATTNSGDNKNGFYYYFLKTEVYSGTGNIVEHRLKITAQLDTGESAELNAVFWGEFNNDPTEEFEITISIDATVLGLRISNSLLPPVKVTYKRGKKLSEVMVDTLKAYGYEYDYVGTLGEATFYFKELRQPGMLYNYNIERDMDPVLREYLIKNGFEIFDLRSINFLGQFDITNNSGWMYAEYEKPYSPISMGGTYPVPGKHYELRFTLAIGADIGGADFSGMKEAFPYTWLSGRRISNNIPGYDYAADLPFGTVPEPADKTALSAAIAVAASLIGTDYTEASWQAVQGALTAAQNLANDDNATQDMVNAVCAALSNAIAALETKPDNSGSGEDGGEDVGSGGEDDGGEGEDDGSGGEDDGAEGEDVGEDVASGDEGGSGDGENDD